MNRKLDAAIAKALGYEVEWRQRRMYDEDTWHDFPCQPGDKDSFPVIVTDKGDQNLPHHSTDGNAMMELDREMRVRNYVLFMNRGPDGAVIAYYNKPTNGAINQSELLARALAAYKALTGKEWRE
ncbi:MAG TPA: hypothetical protein VFC96_07645 [Anaerovoracaceae bacterium]|nr:hypothetical protein [Anaerovoracaceae bacterium]